MTRDGRVNPANPFRARTSTTALQRPEAPAQPSHPPGALPHDTHSTGSSWHRRMCVWHPPTPTPNARER